MNNALHRKRAGFTLVEIMVVVTIIALLASIAVPAYSRARKRAQAGRIMQDLRILDYALDRWAIEKNKALGDIATLTDLRPYLKNGSLLYNSGLDLFGNAYGPVFSVDFTPKVPAPTFAQLSDVAPADFWSPYH